MTGKMKISIVIAAAAICAAAIFVAGSVRTAGTDSLSGPVAAYDFTLVNQNNEKISLGDFGGKIKILSFIYTRCNMETACPRTTKLFKNIQEALDPDSRDGAVFLVVTFDPESDNPEALRRYGEIYGADFSNWHFLTGGKEEIEKVLSEYRIIREDQEDGSIRHSVITYLIDAKNRIRKTYVANQWQPEEVGKEIAGLLKEAE